MEQSQQSRNQTDSYDGSHQHCTPKHSTDNSPLLVRKPIAQHLRAWANPKLTREAHSPTKDTAALVQTTSTSSLAHFTGTNTMLMGECT
jgi:hypothetical protein